MLNLLDMVKQNPTVAHLNNNCYLIYLKNKSNTFHCRKNSNYSEIFLNIYITHSLITLILLVTNDQIKHKLMR